MHRTIMLSATYQMSSQLRPEVHERDPENRWLSRQNRRRLEAEPVRDSILFVGGGLDCTMGQIADSVESQRRAIYLPVNRAALYEMFSTFDYVETGNHLEQRPVTTVPNQALFLMNSAIVHEQARKLAEQLVATGPNDSLANMEATVSKLFEHLVARPASNAEAGRARQFLVEMEQTLGAIDDPRERQLQAWSALCRTLIASNEFIYVD